MESIVLTTLIICLTVLIIVWMLRSSLSNLLNKASKVNVKDGKRELNIETSNDTKNDKDEEPTQEAKIEKIEESLEKELSQDFSDVFVALENNNLEEAEKIFKQCEYNFIQHCVYLFERYKKNDVQVIDKFKSMIRDQNKYNDEKRSYIYWLARCYKISEEYEKIIELYEEHISLCTYEKGKNLLNLRYIDFLIDSDKEKAHNICIQLLNIKTDDVVKAEVYSKLSKIENNKQLTNFCKNKIIEYDTLNTQQLFDSAYELDDEYNGLQLITYEKLLTLDSKNEFALNNFGVSLANFKLNVLSTTQYKKSSELNNTLSMANQANKLLDIGFIDEAKEIANNALEKDNVHQNIYSLLKRIEGITKEENEKLDKLREKFIKYQTNIRKYIEMYYKNGTSLNTDWKYRNYKFSLNQSQLSISYNVEEGESNYKIEMTGSLNNNTLKLNFKERDLNSKGLFDLGVDKELLGYLSDCGNKVILFSAKEEDDYFIEFIKA